ncbi:MAG: GIY-YIG nuclease family protein [Chitinophagaceae bacterium]|nr:GIY-YIG nuclease family protein [Chitinophagaceae bacterium]
MYFVYIIESEKSGIFYKGSTSDYNKRLSQHNEGTNDYTRSKGPWKLIFVREFDSKSEALIEEKRLKKCNKTYLQWLIK